MYGRRILLIGSFRGCRDVNPHPVLYLLKITKSSEKFGKYKENKSLFILGRLRSVLCCHKGFTVTM